MDKIAQGLFDLRFQLSEDSAFGGIQNVTPNSYTTSATQILLVVAVLAFFFMLISGGVMWISSKGDKAGIEAARKRITAALIGLLIVFGIFALILVINSFFGVNIGNLKTGVQLGNGPGVPPSSVTNGGPGPGGNIVGNTPAPSSVPTTTLIGSVSAGGTCSCSNAKLTSSGCKSGYVPICTRFDACDCVVPIGGINPPSTPFPTNIPIPTNTPLPPPTSVPIPTSTPKPTAAPTPAPVACGGTCIEQIGLLCQTGLVCDYSKTGTTSFGVCVIPACYQGKCTCLAPTPTPLPTSLPKPTNTPLPTATNTPIPTKTPTPKPTNTPLPTPTPTPIFSCDNLQSYSVAGVPGTSPLVPVLSPFQLTTVTCDWGQGQSCFNAGNDWVSCNFVQWNGTTAIFQCRAPLVSGLYQNYCKVFSTTSCINVGIPPTQCPAGTYQVSGSAQ